ncbi:MAG: helix-turn-helix transcriptional regulator [Lawsonibacter sp.]|nr:helix-turn-helix transcriptional regulator [Lawsonibacter sp.]
MNDIAVNIKNLRKEKGLSQEQFAQALHVTRQTVSAWERGLSRPGLETLEQIARTLEVEPERLFYGEEEGKKPRYRRVSFWPVLGVMPGWYFGIILLGMTLGRFLGDGDAGILILGQLMLGMLIVFCTCLILDEIRNRDYYEKAEAEEEEKK